MLHSTDDPSATDEPPRVVSRPSRNPKSRRRDVSKVSAKNLLKRVHSRPSRRDEQQPQPHESRLYDHLVPAYQAIWPALARGRMDKGIEGLNIPPGASVLEVGVGTGLALESYPQHARITGVDLSTAMLAEAENLIERRGWQNVYVQPMNAEELHFEDASFDFVTSFHTISVVSNPAKMMREMVRVCRPGGRILVINHFRSPNRLIAKVVDSVGPLTRRIGWRTDLDLRQLIDGLPLEVDDRGKRSPMSLFTILQATRRHGQV